jgi:hypothetical protein
LEGVRSIYNKKIIIFINKIGSSETIRRTTFNFSAYKNNMVSHKKTIDKHFLEWFIGFSEGDGTFIVSYNKDATATHNLLSNKDLIVSSQAVSTPRLFFIINQKEEKILHNIRTCLGFGKVSKYIEYSRFIVADRSNIDRLISIFNGNLLLNKCNNRFTSWLEARNSYSVDKIEYKPSNQEIYFGDNSWLSGFIDAEGCFNASKRKDKRYSIGYRVRLRFILDQKNERSLLVKVKQLLDSGVISERKEIELMYRFSSTSILSHEKLIEYLKSYPLRTFKKVSYVRFTSLLYYIKNRKILPWEGKVLKRIENLINKI